MVGGTAGIGLEIVRRYAGAGRSVVLTGRDAERAADRSLAEVGGDVRGIAAGPGRAGDDRRPRWPTSAGSTTSCYRRDRARRNTVRDYDIGRATCLVTMKLVGYTEVVHALLAAAVARRVDRAVRWAGQGPARTPARPRSRRSTAASRAGPHAGGRARRRSGSTPSTRASSATARTGRQAGGDRGGRGPDADRPQRHHGRHRRRGRLPAPQPLGQRHRPVRRRRLAAARERSGASSATGRMGAAMGAAMAAPGTTRADAVQPHPSRAQAVAARHRRARSPPQRARPRRRRRRARRRWPTTRGRATYRGDDGLVAGLAAGRSSATRAPSTPTTVRGPGGRGRASAGGPARHPGLRQRRSWSRPAS